MSNIWYKEFEKHAPFNKNQIPWNFSVDFKVQSEYLKKAIRKYLSLISELKAGDEDFLKISEKCFSLVAWMKQMEIMGFSTFQSFVDEFLEKEFSDAGIVKKIFTESLLSWSANKSGQYKIGENFFVILEQRFFYKCLKNKWHRVDEGDIFSLMPKMVPLVDKILTEKLMAMHTETKYEKVFRLWQSEKGENQSLSSEFFFSKNGESSVEEILEISLGKIKDIIKNPQNIDYSLKLFKDDDAYFEYVFKIGIIMYDFVKLRRNSGEHTLYLLRDCLFFYEIHKTLDILENKTTSFDQLFIGRKILSSKARVGGHWSITQEALFMAYDKYPGDFALFYKEYSLLLDQYSGGNEDFDKLTSELAKYIEAHVPNNLNKIIKINIVDLGFQGSINLLIKYIIERKCPQIKNEVDLHMYVLAEWFKSVYREKYSSETYSLLTNIESLNINEYLYDFKMDSYKECNFKIQMGNAEQQKLANEELLIVTMLCIIINKWGVY